MVERSFAWAARFRRLAKDNKRLPETVVGLHFVASSPASCSTAPSPSVRSITPSSEAGGVFRDGTNGLWVHRHGSILQEAGLLDYPKYAASSLMNKPTASIRDLALE